MRTSSPLPRPTSSTRRRLAVLVAAAAAVAGLAGCSDKGQAATDGSSGSGTSKSSAAVELKPIQAAVLPVTVGAWERAGGEGDDGDGMVTVEYRDLDTGTAFVVELKNCAQFDPVSNTPDGQCVSPKYRTSSMQDHFDDGWRCGYVDVHDESPHCWKELIGGQLALTCAMRVCEAVTSKDLVEFGRALYGTFDATAPGAAHDAPAAHGDLCAGIDVDAVNAALRPWLYGGEAVVDQQHSENVADSSDFTCRLDLPDGSFAESGSTAMVFHRYRYDDPQAGYDSDGCRTGGSSAAAVFAAARDCFRRSAEGRNGGSASVSAVTAPTGGGLVFADGISFVKAQTGDYWWSVHMTNVAGGAEYLVASKRIADLLPTS